MNRSRKPSKNKIPNIVASRPRRASLVDTNPLIVPIRPTQSTRSLKLVFISLFVTSIIASLYALYILNSTNIFFVTFPFSLTIGILYIITFFGHPPQSTPDIASRQSHQVRVPARPFFAFIFITTFVFIILIGTYFFYYQPRYGTSVNERLIVSQVTTAWSQSSSPPIFIITGKVQNNNAVDLFNVKLQAVLYPASTPSSPLSQQIISIPTLPHNTSYDFSISFPGVSSSQPLNYKLTFK